MKKVRLFESFIGEASRGKIHKAVKAGDYPATIVVIENGDVVHQETVDTPEAVPAAFNVLQKEYPKAKLHVEDKGGQTLFVEGLEVNESLQHGSYYFPKGNVDPAMQPAKGETKYAVICHNTVQMGSNIMYLKSANSGIGQNFEPHILSIHTTEQEAFQAYQDAVKYDEGKTPSCVSFAYGTLKAKGSNFPFDEIGGQRKKLK